MDGWMGCLGYIYIGLFGHRRFVRVTKRNPIILYRPAEMRMHHETVMA